MACADHSGSIQTSCSARSPAQTAEAVQKHDGRPLSLVQVCQALFLYRNRMNGKPLNLIEPSRKFTG